MRSHGQPQLSADRLYFVDAHGNPFFYFADTFWYGMSRRASREDFCTIINDRARKKVNVIQIVVGFVPESSIEEIVASNHWSSPLTTSGKINPAYFKEVRWRLEYIVNKGIVPCIVGGWGWHIDILGIEKVSSLWREILSMLGNLPAFLCLCGEIDLFPAQNFVSMREEQTIKKRIQSILPSEIYFSLRNIYRRFWPLQRNEQRLTKRLAEWRKVIECIRMSDSYHRPLTVHVKGLVTGSILYQNPSLFEYDVIQSGHTNDTKPEMVKTIQEHTRNRRLIINMEPAYEGILGKFWGKEQVEVFLACVHSGAKGHAYGANGVWQMSVDDSFLEHWGKANWRKALNYNGLILLAREVRKIQKTTWWH